MSRLLSLGLISFALLAGSPVFADQHCSCDKKCAAECAKGKSDHCPCKTCDCASGQGCKHGKCGVKKPVSE
jgi:hypothetical protein